jgi:OOP family OmpA-OmpF porin
MRNQTLPALTGVLLATTMFGMASAQTNPAAAQIINQLKPTGMLSDTTRGIRPLPPGPGATPAAPSMAPMAVSSHVAPAHEASAAPSANLDIDFQSGSATLTPRATAALDQLGKALSSPALAAYNFKIVGHTDTMGDPATNQTLSDQRAASVKSFLESKFGIADTRLQSQGVGETDLLIPTPANTPEQRNRRVQVINLGQ